MVNSIILTLLFLSAFAVQVNAQGECNDTIDNDGDGLIDWQYDLGCTDSTDFTEGGLPTRTIENGWTVVEPVEDSQIYYVSSSTGDDDNSGLSPSQPLQTIAAAHALTRDEYSNWILLKRGDVFFESLNIRYGRSRTEPFVVSTYGSNLERPILKTGLNNGINFVNGFKNVLISGISFYAHTRDPDSPDYISDEGGQGFYFFRADADEPGSSILIEDCLFNFYRNNIVQGYATPSDIVLRRNIITNNYSTTSHSQGFYTAGVDSLILEENIFDHNGWLIQAIPPFENDQSGGQATYFNHNTYMTDAANITFRENAFLMASSMGNKFTANSGPASAYNFTIDNNLYVDGETGIGIGGNDDVNPYRFQNINITNNVMLNIGRSQPTTRTLAWYLFVDDWDIGFIKDNLFLNQPDPILGNTFAIMVEGITKDVIIENNTIYNLSTDGYLVDFTDNSNKQNILFSQNKICSPDYYSPLAVSVSSSLSNYTLLQNWYYSSLPTNQWFSMGSSSYDFSGWQNITGETGIDSLYDFCDHTRKIETYQASIGQYADIDSFITEIKKQSRYQWRNEYKIATVNDWIRTGFSDCNISGDVNLDGVVNILDVVLAVNFILVGEYNELADLNNDGNVDVLDIVILIYIILEG